MNELRRPSRSSVRLPSVLAGGELQVPVIEQSLVLFPASDALTLIGLDLQGSLAA